MRVAARVLAPLLAVSGALVGLPAPAAAAPVKGSFASLVSENGDYQGGGAAYFWRAGPDRISVSGSPSDQVSVLLQPGTSGSKGTFGLQFGAPLGQTLTAGTTYEDTLRLPGRDAEHGGIEIGSGTGYSCSWAAGRFTVLDIAPDLSRLWIVYQHGCYGGHPAAFGEIRYNLPVDSDLLVGAAKVVWPYRDKGEISRRVPVRLVNTGAVPVVVSGLSISGTNASDFSAPDNPCPLIAPGETCSFLVGFSPGDYGAREATLTIADSTPAGTHSVDLSTSGRGVGPSSRIPANPDTEPDAATLAGYTPEPVSNLRAKPDADAVELSWTNYSGRTIVRGAPGVTPPATPEDGFAVYDGNFQQALAIDLEPGRNYSFAAFAMHVAAVPAAPTTLTVHGATVTVSVSPSRVTYGKDVMLTGKVVDAVNGAPLEYADFRVLAHRPGAGEEFLDAGGDFTRSGGTFAFSVPAAETYEYAVVFLGNETHLSGVGFSRAVPVAFSVFAKPKTKTGTLGSTFTVVVGVDPLSPGSPVVVEELVKRKWKKVTTGKLNKKSVAQIKVKPKTRGTHTYRVVKAGSARNVAGTSKSVKIKVT